MSDANQPIPCPITEDELKLVIECMKAIAATPERRGTVTITIINGKFRWVEPTFTLNVEKLDTSREWLQTMLERRGRRTR